MNLQNFELSCQMLNIYIFRKKVVFSMNSRIFHLNFSGRGITVCLKIGPDNPSNILKIKWEGYLNGIALRLQVQFSSPRNPNKPDAFSR